MTKSKSKQEQASKPVNTQSTPNKAQAGTRPSMEVDDPRLDSLSDKLEALAFPASTIDSLHSILTTTATNTERLYSLLTNIINEIIVLSQSQHDDTPSVTSSQLDDAFHVQLYHFLKHHQCSLLDTYNPKSLLLTDESRVEIVDWLVSELQCLRMIARSQFVASMHNINDSDASAMPVNDSDAINREDVDIAMTDSDSRNEMIAHDILALTQMLGAPEPVNDSDALSLMQSMVEPLSALVADNPLLSQQPLHIPNEFSAEQHVQLREIKSKLLADLTERLKLLLERFDLTLESLINPSKHNSASSNQLRWVINRQMHGVRHYSGSISDYELWSAGDELVESERRVGLVSLRRPTDAVIVHETGLNNPLPDRGGCCPNEDPKQEQQEESKNAGAIDPESKVIEPQREDSANDSKSEDTGPQKDGGGDGGDRSGKRRNRCRKRGNKGDKAAAVHAEAAAGDADEASDQLQPVVANAEDANDWGKQAHGKRQRRKSGKE